MIHQRFLSKSFWFFAIVLVVIPYRLADAQLFGSPSIGSPALQQTQQRVPAMAPNPNGMIGGASSAIPSVGSRLQVNSTRFVRGSRSRQDFVGSNRSDQTGFVGAGQALGVGRVQSATDNLRLETTKAKINKPLPPQPNKGMYYPRLEVDFENDALPATTMQDVPANADAIDRVAQFSGGKATVSMMGSTAILRGTVGSRRTAELLVQILSFEPGIDQVKSELKIQ